METNVRTPLEIFNLPQHLVVPLFQRPYVWGEADQWLPLWQDVRRVAELQLRDPYANARHFLGAVVLQAQENPVGTLPVRNIIDGQQRLTTLLLLMDAAAAVFEGRADALSEQMEVLTHNLHQFVGGGQTRLKLRHTNRDQAAFDEVMSADPPVDHASLQHSGSLIAKAHAFFTNQTTQWLGDPEAVEFGLRAASLAQVLTRGLQLVVIDLQAQENSQEIFETLNARGTPLTAADLVKNFVFQRLDAEGVDTRKAYAEDWPFDTKFWEADVAVGRYPMSRSSLFLNQWLTARLGEEISPKSTFARFKHFVEHECGQKMSDLLVTIKAEADLYEQWTLRAADPDRSLSRTEMAVYRMAASGVELLKPVLLWLHDPARPLPTATIDAVIAATESWVVRRQLLRLSSSDLGRVVADLIHTHRTTPAEELADRVRGYLIRLQVTSTYWPGDAEIRQTLVTENAYRRYPRSRLRMYLEAVEDHLRAVHKYPPVPRRGYPIEHVLPQKWDTHWPVEGLEAEIDRAAHVHRLGNLTLLTDSLNSAVSNGPWDGPHGKRAKLAKHDINLLNRIFREDDTLVWDEAAIDRRTAAMIDIILLTWPVPAGHTGEVVDPQASEQTWVELKHLIAAGLLAPGTKLTPRAGKWASKSATVLPNGQLQVDDQRFDTPSGAGRYVKGGASNGWVFWLLPDGRRLVELRATYRGEKPQPRPKTSFDWSRLHAILEALPEGYWTSYSDLAELIGTAPQPLGNHITSCRRCVNAHRVLTADGTVADAFRWPDPDDHRDPADMLRNEGLTLTGGQASADRRLSSEALIDLIPEQA